MTAQRYSLHEFGDYSPDAAVAREASVELRAREYAWIKWKDMEGLTTTKERPGRSDRIAYWRRIHEAGKARGWTRKQTAEAIGATYDTVHNGMRQGSAPAPDVAARIAEVFGIETE